MIYTNKAQFWPLFIIVSSLFIPFIIIVTLYSIFYPGILGFVILFILIVLYFFIILAINKERKSHRNYVIICDDNIKIKYDNFSKDENEVTIKYTDVIQIDYYKINSFISWLQLITLSCPKVAYIKYYDRGKIIQNPFGFFEIKEIKNICESKGVKLFIH